MDYKGSTATLNPAQRGPAERGQFIAVERRSEPRFPVDLPVRVKCINPLISMGPARSARLIEVSRRGMRLRSIREFLPGALIQVFLGQSILLAEVRWCTREDLSFVMGARVVERLALTASPLARSEATFDPIA